MRARTLVFVMVCGGCAGHLKPGYSVQVAAHSISAERKPQSFVIRAPQNAADDVVSTEVIGIVKTALKKNGLAESSSMLRADIVVDVTYAMGPAETVRALQSEPIWRNVPGPAVQRQEQVGTRKDGSPIYRTVTEPGPLTQQYVGERWICATSTEYQKAARIMAWANHTPTTAGELWSVKVTAQDQSASIVEYAPRLVTAATAYIGQNFSGPIAVSIGKNGRPFDATKRKAAKPDSLNGGGVVMNPATGRAC